MVISEKQIMQLMDFVNDYCVLLANSPNKIHATMFNNIRSLLDKVTAQQSEELKVIE